VGQLTILVLILVALSLAAALVLFPVQRKYELRLAVLMARIDELEMRIDQNREMESDASPATVHAPRHTADPPQAVSGDVLAGKSSFVQRVVEEETQRPASTGELAIQCVHARLEDNLQPAELASELSISLRTLERGLTAELGCTPRQLILAMNMREARRLLESGRYRVNEVAQRLGFSNPSNFSRSFRSFYHVPPTTIARRHDC